LFFVINDINNNKERMDSLYKKRARLEKKLRRVKHEIITAQREKQIEWLEANGLSDDVRFYRNVDDVEGTIRYKREDFDEIVCSFSPSGQLECIADDDTSYKLNDDEARVKLSCIILRFVMAVVRDYKGAQSVIITKFF
jgi:hypothetical protein